MQSRTPDMTPLLRQSRWAAVILILGAVASLQAATWYVAPGGKDTDAGSAARPFASLARGQAVASPGDTVLLRGGTYAFKSTTEAIAVTLSKSGSPGRPIHYFAYPGETPIFDFKGMTALKRIKGVLVTGSWLHLKGLEMKGVSQNLRDGRSHENWCLYISGGSHDVFERLDLHHNMGPGMFIGSGSNNLILNCDSHDNFDLYSYANGKLVPGENADGFGFHSHDPADTGTVFRGCRAWWNADDGWDFIGAAAAVTVDNCWSWNHGYKPETMISAGNGNGFKVGGYGMPPTAVPDRVPRHVVQFCMAFGNRAAGFYSNHHPVANAYFSNTAFENKSANFDLLGYDLAKKQDANYGILKNNLSYGGNLSRLTGAGVQLDHNSWNLIPSVGLGDFLSLDTTGISGPRKADGSLPDLSFLKPRLGSLLIDRGVNLGFPFSGNAPDLGAFESGKTSPLIAPDRRSRAPSGTGAAIGRDLNGRSVDIRAHPSQARYLVFPAR